VKRRLFNLVCAVSFFLCISTGVLWLRSYWWFDYLSGHSQPTRDGYQYGSVVVSDTGRIEIELWTRHYHGPPFGQFVSRARYRGTVSNNSLVSRNKWLGSMNGFHWLGFFFYTKSSNPTSINKGVVTRYNETFAMTFIPMWAIVVATAFLPLIWVISRHRRKVGGCPTCHYDLTGNTSGVCPECGTGIGSVANSATSAVEKRP
jgi:hypothetical protein